LVTVQQDEQQLPRVGDARVSAIAVDAGSGRSFVLQEDGFLMRVEEYGAMHRDGGRAEGSEWLARLPRVAGAWSYAHYQADAQVVVCAARSGEVVAVGAEDCGGTALGTFEAVRRAGYGGLWVEVGCAMAHMLLRRG
jgi:hypothetical protein